MQSIGLRPACAVDSDFVYSVVVAALKEYIDQTWGWDEAFQADYHWRHFDPAVTQIITCDGRDAGFLIVERDDREIRIWEIDLLPDFQNRGIGTALLSEILREARQTNRKTWLQVLKVSPAIRLYERLGFVLVGETETHWQMERSPFNASTP